MSQDAGYVPTPRLGDVLATADRPELSSQHDSFHIPTKTLSSTSSDELLCNLWHRVIVADVNGVHVA